MWDTNGNGHIDNGRELFGDNTLLANGWTAVKVERFNASSSDFAALPNLAGFGHVRALQQAANEVAWRVVA